MELKASQLAWISARTRILIDQVADLFFSFMAWPRHERGDGSELISAPTESCDSPKVQFKAS